MRISLYGLILITFELSTKMLRVPEMRKNCQGKQIANTQQALSRILFYIQNVLKKDQNTSRKKISVMNEKEFPIFWGFGSHSRILLFLHDLIDQLSQLVDISRIQLYFQIRIKKKIFCVHKIKVSSIKRGSDYVFINVFTRSFYACNS